MKPQYSVQDLEGRGFGPHPVSIVEHLDIVLSDNVTLALKLWLPTDNPKKLSDSFANDEFHKLYRQSEVDPAPSKVGFTPGTNLISTKQNVVRYEFVLDR